MKKINFPFKHYFQKDPQSIDPAVSFSILHPQGDLEGRYLNCFNFPHASGLRKEDRHRHDSESSCSQGCTAHNSPNTQVVLLVHFSSSCRYATTKTPGMFPRAQEPQWIRLQGLSCMAICVMIQEEC